jgi:MFS family permease
MKNSKWLLVFLLSTGLALDYLARLALFSVLPPLKKDLALGDVALGLVASSFLWTYGLLSPIAGFVGDRFSRRTVLIVSLAGWSMVTVLSGFVTNAWQLVAMRVFLAMTQVCYMPVGQAFLADFHGPETRGRASGFFQSGSSAGIFLAGLPVAWLATHLGWRTMLIVCGALGIVFSLVLWRFLPRLPGQREAVKPQAEKPVSLLDATALLRTPSMLTLMTAFAMTSITYWILFSYLPLFVYEKYHLSLEAAAFQATFYIQASAVALMPLYATVSDRWSARDPRKRYLACALASALGLPALAAIGIGNQVPILTGGLILFGLVMASSDASWLAMLCNFTVPRQRATAYGLLNFSGTLAGGFAAMSAALLMKRIGLGVMIASLGAMYVVIALLVLFCGYGVLERDRQRMNDASVTASAF